MEFVYQALVIALVIISVFLLIMRYGVSNIMQKRLIAALENGDELKFDKIIEKRFVKLLIPPFNIHYMSLNMALMKQKEKCIDDEFSWLLAMRKDKKQTMDITLKAFHYYVKLKDKKRVKDLFSYIIEEGDENTKYESTVLYDIFILERANHIDELQENMDTLPLAQRSINAYLISLQYENKEESAMAEKFENLSKQYLHKALQQQEVSKGDTGGVV